MRKMHRSPLKTLGPSWLQSEDRICIHHRAESGYEVFTDVPITSVASSSFRLVVQRWVMDTLDLPKFDIEGYRNLGGVISSSNRASFYV